MFCVERLIIFVVFTSFIAFYDPARPVPRQRLSLGSYIVPRRRWLADLWEGGQQSPLGLEATPQVNKDRSTLHPSSLRAQVVGGSARHVDERHRLAGCTSKSTPP